MAVFVANVLLILSISYLVWKRQPVTLRDFYWPALILKISAGLALGWIYLYYFNLGDTISYWSDGTRLANAARDNLSEYLSFLFTNRSSSISMADFGEQEPRAIFFFKITSIFCLLTNDNYWLIASYYSLICFVSGWTLTTYIAKLLPKATGPAIFSIHFLPTVVFWSSGLMKESLAMACLYHFALIFLKVWYGERIRVIHLLLLVVDVWLLWNLKYYYLGVLLPIVITGTTIHRWLMPRYELKPITVAVSSLLFFVVPLAIVLITHPNFYPQRLLGVIVENHDAIVSFSSHEDIIHYQSLSPTIISVVRNAPMAIFSCLFRPFLWEASTPFQFIVALENSGILVLFFAWLFGIFKHRKNYLLNGIALQIVIYSCFLALFLALSTPNFGTLSRYRVGFLPFLMIVICTSNPLLSTAAKLIERTSQRLVP
jgi:hypothetical protein